MQQKYVEKNKKFYHMFVDLEKTFDRAPRWTLRWALKKQVVSEKLVRLVLALYDDSKSWLSAASEMFDAFSVSVGVHQGSALSSLLFNLVIQGAAKNVMREYPGTRCMQMF